MNMMLAVLLGAIFAGCSHGLQEVGFVVSEEPKHYIVTRDVVSSRFTANQPHTAGQFHCTGKRTSEEMAEMRQDGNDHTWYTGCLPAEDFPQHKYALTSDQSIGSLLQGPVSAAILGGALAAGISLSGSETNVTQTGGGANAGASAAANASSVSKATGGSVMMRGGYKGK